MHVGFETIKSQTPSGASACGGGWRLVQLLSYDLPDEDSARDAMANVKAVSETVAALVLDPSGWMFRRSGTRRICQTLVRLTAPGCAAASSRECRSGCTAKGRNRKRPQRLGLVARYRRRSRRAGHRTPSISCSESNCSETLSHFSQDACSDAAQDYASLSDWMMRLPDEAPLASLALPGTHDSATFELWPLPVTWGYVRECGQTQDWNLRKQLAAGIRFFDLRVKANGWLYHGPMACKLSFQEALQILADWIQTHCSECLLLRIKDEEASETS